MDSKVVNRQIKQLVWPMLREGGFSRFDARNAWRSNARAVEVVNFQSFNSRMADSLGCTSFSFALNLGVYYLDVHGVPWIADWPAEWIIRPQRPEEARCQARYHLNKSISQAEFPRNSIWYVKRDGSNVVDAVTDAAKVIRDVGLPWLFKFRDPIYALKEFLLPRTLDGEEFHQMVDILFFHLIV